MFKKFRARRAQRKAEEAATQAFFERLLTLFTSTEYIYGPFSLDQVRPEQEEC